MATNASSKRNSRFFGQRGRGPKKAPEAQVRKLENKVEKIEQEVHNKQRKPRFVKRKSKARGNNKSRGRQGFARVGNRATRRKLKFNAAQWAIYRSITLPYESEVVRYQSDIGIAKTADAKPWTKLSVGWQQSADVPNRQIDSTQTFAAVFRDPVRSAIYYDANPEEQTTQYNFYGQQSQASDEVPIAPALSWTVFTDGENAPLGNVYGVPSTAYAPHGPMVGGGIAKDRKDLRFFWLDQGRVLLVGTAAVDSKIRIYQAFDGQTSFYKSVDLPLGPISVVLFLGQNNPGVTDPRGYYAFEFDGLETEGAAIEVTSMTYIDDNGDKGGDYYCHLMLPNLEKNLASIDTIRIFGASDLMQQAASVESIEGKIVQQQVPEDKDWTQIGLETRPYNTLMKYNQPWSDNSYHGAYGFLKPVEITDFDFIKFKRDYQGGLLDIFYPLNCQTPYLVTCANVTNAAGQDSDWRFAWNIDFQTTDFWRKTIVGESNEDDWKKVFKVLKHTPQFYHNGDHVKGVMNVLGGLSKGAEKFGNFINDAGSIAEGIMSLVG